ncbi:MAG TPA: amino acid ABC transporter permease [Anaerolineae bacterium]|nr:amino acid ABC transporter permease [Anaerolineae bacterium]
MNRSYVTRLVLVWVAIFLLLASLFRLLEFDLAFMSHWMGFLFRGIGYTIIVSAISIFFAVILALIGALARLSRNPIANGVSTFYVSFVRGTPLLVQVYMIYLGLPQVGQSLEMLGLKMMGTGAPAWVPDLFAWLAGLFVLDAIPSGILALSINYGAYMTETFRAGIQSIHPGQREAALALGMTPAQCMRRIILPQALRIVIPPVGNDFIAMLKDSSLVSLMGVMELTWRAQKVGRRYFRSLELLTIAALFYWIMTIALQTVQGRLEERLGRGRER